MINNLNLRDSTFYINVTTFYDKSRMFTIRLYYGSIELFIRIFIIPSKEEWS